MTEGTIIQATMRSEDLIPAFIDALSVAIDDHSLSCGNQNLICCANYGAITENLGAMERRAKVAGYYDSDDAGYDLEFLTDALDAYAPQGCYFGAHPGDGSDFGFWKTEDNDDD